MLEGAGFQRSVTELAGFQMSGLEPVADSNPDDSRRRGAGCFGWLPRDGSSVPGKLGSCSGKSSLLGKLGRELSLLLTQSPGFRSGKTLLRSPKLLELLNH